MSIIQLGSTIKAEAERGNTITIAHCTTPYNNALVEALEVQAEVDAILQTMREQSIRLLYLPMHANTDTTTMTKGSSTSVVTEFIDTPALLQACTELLQKEEPDLPEEIVAETIKAIKAIEDGLMEDDALQRIDEVICNNQVPQLLQRLAHGVQWEVIPNTAVLYDDRNVTHRAKIGHILSDWHTDLPSRDCLAMLCNFKDKKWMGGFDGTKLYNIF